MEGVEPATYRLTPGARSITTACPDALTIWLETALALPERDPAAVALATEALICGLGEWGRVRLERTT